MSNGRGMRWRHGQEGRLPSISRQDEQRMLEEEELRLMQGPDGVRDEVGNLDDEKKREVNK